MKLRKLDKNGPGSVEYNMKNKHSNYEYNCKLLSKILTTWIKHYGKFVVYSGMQQQKNITM